MNLNQEKAGSAVQPVDDTLARIIQCAVQRRSSSVGAIPTRQLSLRPVAIGAAAEVTKLPKPSMERVASDSSACRRADASGLCLVKTSQPELPALFSYPVLPETLETGRGGTLP